MVTLFKQFIIFFIFLILFSGNLKSENLLKKNFNIVTCEGHEEACLIMEQFSFEYENSMHSHNIHIFKYLVIVAVRLVVVNSEVEQKR